jgi:signal transduction histidine kinase
MDSMLSGRSLLSVGVGKKQLLSVLSTVANMTSLVLAGIDKAVLTDEAHRKELANYGAVLDLSQGAVHALAGRFMVVDGNMQLALRLLKKDPERARDLILKALEATRKANQYMRDYFQPVKENTFKIKIKPEEIELPVLLAEMKELLKNKFKAVDGEGESEGEQKTRVELILRDGLPKMVITDKDKVFDIVLELVNNAEKYSPKGSNIRIVFQPIDEAADDTAREMLISVIDQGIGIRPDQITRIFKERDLRLHPEMQKGNSTGNGLYVSNKIVNMLGGTMKVVSEEGKGSTFSFTLPAAY